VPRSFSLTALGTVPIDRSVPSRSGAKAGDTVWLSGPVGDAGLGLKALQGALEGPADALEVVVAAYRRPQPDAALGLALAPLSSAMMDVSDGVLIDARRMAEASGVEFHIDLSALPLSPAHCALAGDGLAARLAAATAGDDYCLLFTTPMAMAAQVRALKAHLTCVGSVREGCGISLVHEGKPVALPVTLGYQH
jgi:thiamine-monophosphate kinase